MKTRILLLILSLLILPTNSLLAQSVLVKISLPVRNQVVSDSVLVEATVTSEYQLKEVRASVEDSSVGLTYDSGKFRGLLILTGLTTGVKTVFVTATDIFDQRGSDSVSINHQPRIGIELYSWPET